MKQRNFRTALVAGGAGFVGSHLCEALLRDGYEVMCLDSLLTGRRSNLDAFEREPRFDFVEADVIASLPAALARSKANFVFNLACAASPPHYQADPEHTMMTSVAGTRNLLRYSERHGARFLLASTSEVYGDPEIHPQTEAYWGHVNPTGPRACYDEGKRAAESLSFDFARARRAEVRVARIFNTYGPRMRADDGRVVSNVVTQALEERDITIYGTGEQTRSFCYVDDLVVGLVRLMVCEGPVLGPINLGNPNELTVADLVQRVLALTGSQSRIVSRPLPIDDPQRRRPDITLAKTTLGWTPKVPLEQGLAATIAYFESELRKRLAARAPALDTPRRSTPAVASAR